MQRRRRSRRAGSKGEWGVGCGALGVEGRGRKTAIARLYRDGAFARARL
jgi:hypothetical protein